MGARGCVAVWRSPQSTDVAPLGRCCYRLRPEKNGRAAQGAEDWISVVSAIVHVGFLSLWGERGAGHGQSTDDESLSLARAGGSLSCCSSTGRFQTKSSIKPSAEAQEDDAFIAMEKLEGKRQGGSLPHAERKQQRRLCRLPRRRGRQHPKQLRRAAQMPKETLGQMDTLQQAQPPTPGQGKSARRPPLQRKERPRKRSLGTPRETPWCYRPLTLSHVPELCHVRERFLITLLHLVAQSFRTPGGRSGISTQLPSGDFAVPTKKR